MAYPFKDIEKKWQKYWEENGTNKTDMNSDKPNYYTFCMFPYPSGDRLHLGHWFQYSCPDVHARFRRMKGYNVLQPIGYDSFGLPAENYAIKTGIHPAVSTNANVKIFTEQYKGIGGMFDWDHLLTTSNPDYYKWTQWLFLILYKNGLAYRKEAPANWCPKCSTVVANAEVMADGTHERCDTLIERKPLMGWFFKITDYNERLLDGLNEIDWPEKTKISQRNWIGKSKGAIINFKVVDTDFNFEVFTTRPDTLFGATYCTLAPELDLVDKITSNEQKNAVKEYREFTKKLSEIDRQSTVREKTGVFTGAYAVNPINGNKIPIWISDYVLATYGTGAVMAVPAHDTRDFEFATKFDIPKILVVQPEGKELNIDDMEEAYVESGIMINSGEFNGMKSDIGIIKITEKLEKEGNGRAHITYKLRDWSVSRQRYWGVPIPIVYCKDCGVVPVPENQLPLTLPKDENIDFRPKGQAPLSLIDSFMNTQCPKCGKPAKRDPETMDTFVCSSWYFLRYIDAKNDKKPFDKEQLAQWFPANCYIGGMEHANGHLLYARFITKALFDFGLLSFDEPFKKLIHQGMITRNGSKMSKSKGNAVSPDQFITKYGTDVFRLYITFMTNFREGGDWSDEGIRGTDRFLNRVWRIITENLKESNENKIIDDNLNYILNYSIKEISVNLEDFYFNTGVSRLMELTNELYIYVNDKSRFNQTFFNEAVEKLILLLAPYAPHIAEELWEIAGKVPSVFDQKWPEYEEKALKKSDQTITVQINGKVRANFTTSIDKGDDEIKELSYLNEKIQKYTEGKNIFKTILINGKNGKMVNIVVK